MGPMESLIQSVGKNLDNRKSKQAVKPGIEGSGQDQIVHRHLCSKVKYIYIYSKKKEKKKEEKEKKNKKNQFGTSVPVHPKRVPVQLARK